MTALPCPLLLASASPARASLLSTVGLTFTQEASQVHEPARLEDESLHEYVLRLCRYKSEAMQARHPEACILTCDTVIELDHHTLGKPQNEREAFEMIRLMAGRHHTVHTGILLCSPAPDRDFWKGYDSTRIAFNSLTDEAIHEYVHRAQPFLYAGAYAIQKEGADLVAHMDGRLDTVIGLPLHKVSEGLETLLGIDPLKPI